ncbi:hypothetical protein CWO90_32595 [Bradyrhizobium sp. Leo121]|nr:hypothetical protein CWO90_32595 [Bradyrhizobium sp. Leo121]
MTTLATRFAVPTLTVPAQSQFFAHCLILPIARLIVVLHLLTNRTYDIFAQSSISYIRKSEMGRKKLWTERLTVPLNEETVERMDSLLAKDEVRLDLIRTAIERELKRRERQTQKPG